jgi:hypothetical protein
MFRNLFGKKVSMQPQQEVGYLIASGLGWACTNMAYSDEEREWMTAGDVPAPIVWREAAGLSMFGGDWAIFELLEGNPHREIVRKGYLDAWREFATKGKSNAEAFEIFDSRLPEYSQAVASGRPVQERLAGFLAASVGISLEQLLETRSPEIATRVGHINILASFMSLRFDASYLAAANELADKGLIKRPQSQ